MSTNAVIDHRYRLGPRLGWGGAADVFEARDLRLERRVAVKRYRAETNSLGLRRFLAEAELLAGLSHPGLLTVYDVGFHGARPFLVLQLAAGGTLRDRLDTGPLPPDRVAEIGAELAEVLSYVHDQGIVHRDVKPSNVLFDDEGISHLADFGIARALGAARLTDSKEFVGTAAYLAPEQVAGKDVGPPADVYALGLVLLECLSGESEYTGSDVEMALARLTHSPRIPASWGKDWRAVLTAMTEMDPEDRPDAAECARLLRAIETGDTVPLAVPAPRKRRVYASVAGMAAAALVTFGFTMGAPPQLTGRPVPDPAQVVHTPATPQPPPEPSPVRSTSESSVVPAPPGRAKPVGATGSVDPGGGKHDKSGKPKPGKGKPGKGKAGKG